MIATMRAIQIVTRSFCETCLLLVIVMSDLTNGGVSGPLDTFSDFDEMSTTTTTTFPPYTHPQWIEPYFDPTTPRNVTALMGKSAYLSCRVRNLGNKTVSWIRHRDIHILTVGSYTYTSDLRFQATHHHDSDDWTLQIKWTQKRDAGMYECQISTQPVRSYFVNLNVVVPTATILGGPDLHVDKGSTINLTCTVKFSPEPPAYIFWYHHEEVINYDSSRGGVSVITEKGDVTTSFLLIQNADLADSGKYSCAPSNADVASVRVHVLNGEHPEAMQTGSSGCQYSWLTILMLMTMIFYYNQQYISCNLTHSLLKTTCHPTYNTSNTKSTTLSSSSSSTISATTCSASFSSTLTTVMAKPTTTITTTTTRCIHYRNKNLKNSNKTTVTNNNKSTITNIRIININTSLHCPDAFDSDCPDCHHLLANNTNFDNNCYCNQKLVSPAS